VLHERFRFEEDSPSLYYTLGCRLGSLVNASMRSLDLFGQNWKPVAACLKA
jgi:hypothetical protein